MLNKNLDEWLYLTGMGNALDELEKNKQRCWIVFVQRKKMMSG